MAIGEAATVLIKLSEEEETINEVRWWCEGLCSRGKSNGDLFTAIWRKGPNTQTLISLCKEEKRHIIITPMVIILREAYSPSFIYGSMPCVKINLWRVLHLGIRLSDKAVIRAVSRIRLTEQLFHEPEAAQGADCWGCATFWHHLSGYGYRSA